MSLQVLLKKDVDLFVGSHLRLLLPLVVPPGRRPRLTGPRLHSPSGGLDERGSCVSLCAFSLRRGYASVTLCPYKLTGLLEDVSLWCCVTVFGWSCAVGVREKSEPFHNKPKRKRKREKKVGEVGCLGLTSRHSQSAVASSLFPLFIFSESCVSFLWIESTLSSLDLISGKRTR